MVRYVQKPKIGQREALITAARINGARLAAGLQVPEAKFAGLIFNVRGQGLYQGFSRREPALKKQLEEMALQLERLLLPDAGVRSIRLRPNLSVTGADIEQLMAMLTRCLHRLRS